VIKLLEILENRVVQETLYSKVKKASVKQSMKGPTSVLLVGLDGSVVDETSCGSEIEGYHGGSSDTLLEAKDQLLARWRHCSSTEKEGVNPRTSSSLILTNPT
jgi:hypothetical protein